VIDARAATAAALDEIAGRDGPIGAFTDVTADRATAEAAAADRERAAGFDRGPLHGVPIGVKQLFDVAGADQSYGSDVRDGAIADRDAAIVRRLRRAGAVVIGTTRSHEFGWGITTQHATRGSTRNPRDLSRVPGGSSGGSAAAVAAGLVPLAVGSDTGGSIRIPAAFCGVLGLKTTFGRISRAGGVALAPSFDSPGFLATTTALLAAALDATAGPDPADPVTLGAPPLGPVPRPDVIGRLRVAVVDDLGGSPPAARQRSLDATAEALVELGAGRVDVAMPPGERWLEAFVPFQMAEARDVHERILATYPGRAGDYGADVRSRLDAAGGVGVGEYLAARRLATELTATIERSLTAADVILSLVGTHGPSTVDDPDHVTDGTTTTTLRTSVMPATVPQNIAGLPSITVPVGVDDDGLPIGVQITGRRWSEPLLLAVSRSLEHSGLVAIAPMEGR